MNSIHTVQIPLRVAQGKIINYYNIKIDCHTVQIPLQVAQGNLINYFNIKIN